MRRLLLLCCFLLPSPLPAQQDVDTTRAPTGDRVRVVNSTRDIMLSYANDVFAQTDRYFTQGVMFRVAHPGLRRLDDVHILSPLPKPSVFYSASLLHESYTPTSIRSDSVLRGDRPYAALLMAQLQGVAQAGGGGEDITSAITIGVIGAPAMGREIQTAIHRATGDFIPLGWQHQIRTDALLNYSFAYRRPLLRLRSGELSASGRVDAGTVQCRLEATLIATLRPLAAARTLVQPAIFGGITGRLVGYDARLQGGVFNRSSPYTLTASQISRAVGKAFLQLRFDCRGIGVGGEYNWLSREFETGLPHAWGRLFVQYTFEDASRNRE